MPRRRVDRRPAVPLRPSTERREHKADGSWVVRDISGAAATKAYRCPGCSQPIHPGTPHVVAWPVEKMLLSAEAIDERRHWHRACWARRH